MYVILYSSSGLFMGSAAVTDNNDDNLVYEVDIIKKRHQMMLDERKELEVKGIMLDERLPPTE